MAANGMNLWLETENSRAVATTGAAGIFESPKLPKGYEVTATVRMKVEFKITTPGRVPIELIIAQEAARNLWHVKKYLDAYVNHLLGGMTDEEFDQVAASFIQDRKNHLSDEQLRFCASYLKSLLPDVEFDDVATILNVELDDLLALTPPQEAG